MSFNKALMPGKAYWIMVKDEAAYAKDKISGNDYSIDWSEAETYQIGETVNTSDFNATLRRVDGILDEEYPDIRNIEIGASFLNKKHHSERIV